MIDLSEFTEVETVSGPHYNYNQYTDAYYYVRLRNGHEWEFQVVYDTYERELYECDPRLAYNRHDDFIERPDAVPPEVQAIREVVVPQMKLAILTYRLTGQKTT